LSPEVADEGGSQNHFGREDVVVQPSLTGLVAVVARFPALKRRAIAGSSYGTGVVSLTSYPEPLSFASMAATRNKYGLSRSIPEDVKREVRRRSRFGCVLCRAAIAHYEHIDPEFNNAKAHDPKRMCSLCGSCHDKVTRGILSKEAIWKAYALLQEASNIRPPQDFFDFHTGEALLLLGTLFDGPAPDFVFSVYGEQVFRICPGKGGADGAIYARFTDENGAEALTIDGNQWVASMDSWDVKVQGQRITVHAASGLRVLTLRACPPGKLVIEHLDMRFGPAHLMATEHSFIVGHYCKTPRLAAWVFTALSITKVTSESVGVSVHHPQAGKPMVSIGTKGGADWAAAGISVAKGCSFKISEFVTGVKTVDHVRYYFFDCAAKPGLPELVKGNHFLLLPDISDQMNR
jgi:hypothetical protein